MYKLFTLEQAEQLIPRVSNLLVELQETMKDALDLKENLNSLERYSIDAFNTVQEIHFLFRIACDCNQLLSEIGVLLEDVEAGIVKFPSQQDGEVIHLTWQQGDQEIRRIQRLGLSKTATQIGL